MATGDARAGVAGRLVLGAIVLVALVLPGRLLASEHAADHELVPYADTGSGARAVPGQTWHVDAGVVTADRDRIELVEVRPRVSVDTAAADIRVRLCTSPGVAGSLPAGCRTVVAAAGTKVRLQAGAARLVVSVTPHRTGRVLIEGYDVTYLDAGRRGTEHAGTEVRLRVG